MNVVIPAAGESITTGVLLSWEAKDGTFVSKDQTIFIFETDKVNLEVPAPCNGILNITIKNGTQVKVGDIVGAITPKEDPAVAPKEPEIVKEPEKIEPVPAQEKPADDYKLAAETLAKEVLAWRNRDIIKPNDVYTSCEETNKLALENIPLARVLGFIVENNDD
jgi:2-oxoglutarate dehydrogenase E2 component (dihydrolipoamide succinyltransferase)